MIVSGRSPIVASAAIANVGEFSSARVVMSHRM
jgi:hypothetical protein